MLLILVWFFKPEYLGVFEGQFIWLVLGFFFMPLTALAYGLCHFYDLVAEEWWVAVPIVAALFDLGLVGRFRKKKKDDE